MCKRVLVLDMGNVLISYDTEAILRRQGVTDKADMALFQQIIFDSDVWQNLDRGTAEKTEFIPLIQKLPPHLANLAEDMLLKHIFAESYMPPIPQTEELVRRAYEKGIPIYLLSNAGQDFYQYSKGIPALRYFTGTFISSDYHLLKPEREIYETFFRTFSLAPSDCVFVDDMQRNIDGAKACGMDGICFNAAREDIAVLYRKLAEKGIIL